MKIQEQFIVSAYVTELSRWEMHIRETARIDNNITNSLCEKFGCERIQNTA